MTRSERDAVIDVLFELQLWLDLRRNAADVTTLGMIQEHIRQIAMRVSHDAK
jgi:hypothetical protein